MGVLIGGERAWRKRRLGDLGVAYQWVNGEPAMILFPATRPAYRAGAFVICLSAAHRYAGADGHPNLGYAIPQAYDAARVMGLSLERGTVRKIIDAIVEGLPDLVEMPPEPIWAKDDKPMPVVGELSVRQGGRVVIETEVRAPSAGEVQAEAA
ncbi:MAG: hypothetical protein KA142_01470 [Chromatiaceae bacterium]|nr:hypothetical protein [Chromatiaceae bacterium]